MNIHNLKIAPRWFEDVKSGNKNFEVRINDRDYKVGDILILNEFLDGFYTGRKIERTISYIFYGKPKYGIINGFCILGLMKKRYKK